MEIQERQIREATLVTKGGAIQVRFETEASTFRELQVQVAQEFGAEYGSDVSFDPNRMKAVIAGLDITLEADSARLPDGSFKLFYLARKTDSGSFDRYEAYKEIKKIIDENEDASSFFNEDRHFTNKSNTDLQKLLMSWNSKVSANAEVLHVPVHFDRNIYDTITQLEERISALEEKVEECVPASTTSNEYENMMSKFKAYR